MAIKLFDLGFALRAIDQGLTGTLRQPEVQIKAIDATAEKVQPLKQWGESLAAAGAIAGAAGGVVALGLKSAVDSAMAMQAEMAHVATAMNDGADTMRQLNEVQETAEKLAANGVIGVEQLGQAYYIARSNMLDHADALKAVAAAQNLVTGTTQNAAEASAQMESATRTLTTLSQMTGRSIGSLADQMAKLQSSYAFKDVGEVTNALQYAMPAAKGAGVAVEQMNAALAMLSAGGLHGAEAGTGFQEMVTKLTTDNKLLPFIGRTRQGGLDLQATLGNLKNAFGNLAPLDRARELKSLGFGERDIRGVEIMIDRVAQFGAVEKDLANSQGMAAALAATRMGAADEQLARLSNNWDLIKESIGAPLLGAIASAAGGLASVAQHLNAFAHAHPAIARFVATFAAITAGALLLVGAIGVLIGGLAFVGATLAPVVALIGLSGGWLVALAAGAVAVGAAIMTWWPQIKAFFVKTIPEAFNWGVNLLKTLAKGIESAVMWPVHAIEHVFSRVARFIPHSPAEEGPLRNLDRVRIVETIADTMKPAPMIHAIRRVAAAAAIAAPMMVGAGAGPAIASSSPARQSSSGVTLNYAPHVELQVVGGDAAAIKRIVLDALEEHKDEVERLLASVRERKGRLNF